MEPYVRNLWYMAAWEQEVPNGSVLPRTLLDERWILYRKADGGYAMLADRCPHRFAPLSRGRLDADRIVCGYHGLAFAPDGQCVHNPFSATVPKASVRALPVTARHGALWFWPGDPSQADQDQIPDFAFIDEDPDTVLDRTWMAANYELITDNLMDLSHAEFLHVDTFGTNGALFGGEHKAVQDDSGGIWSKWSMPGSAPPQWAGSLVPEGRTVDQWLEMRWHAPASMALFIGIALGGTDRKQLVVPPMANPHIITPETQRSSHYFFTRSPGEESEAMAKRVFNEEDQPMIEAVQQAMDGKEFWGEHPLILASDAAAVRARRRLMQLRRSEQSEIEQAA